MRLSPADLRLKVAYLIRYAALLAMIAISGNAGAHEFRTAYLEVADQGLGIFSVSWRIPKASRNEAKVELVATEECHLSQEREIAMDRLIVRDYTLDCSGITGPSGLTLEGIEQVPFDVLVKFSPENGGEHFQHLHAGMSQVSLAVPEDGHQRHAGMFMQGMQHVFGGYDHLFYIVLLFLFLRRKWQPMLIGVTTFTIAHSLSLGLAMLDVIRIPSHPVEAVIALTICYFAISLLKGLRADSSNHWRWQAVIAFCGLIHGLGFANSLSDLGLAKEELLFGLVTFNLGIEIAQIAILLISALSYKLIAWTPRQFVMLQAERITATIIGVVGSFWYLERIFI